MKQLVTENFIKSLEEKLPGCLKRNVPLRDISWYKIGGMADVIIEPENMEKASILMRYLHENNMLYTVIGSTSNILFDDNGYRGVLVKIAQNNFTDMKIDEDGTVHAGAGIWVPFYVRNLIKHSLDGCIHAIGIPGALGGLIIMNGGSMRKGIGEQLINLTIIDKNGDIKTLSKNECDFGYRSSSLQNKECIVIKAKFHYAREYGKNLRHHALEILAERNKKFPRKLPSCGSVFLSYPEMYEIIGPPGRAIEELGFKGKTQGGAQISPKHANFIVNKGGATARDVLYLIWQCRAAIMEKSGFDLRCEVRFLPSEGALCQAHIEADKLFLAA